MARYRGPKNRIARRFAANIFGKARNPLLHKQHPPGQHGAKRKKKSDFGMQLDERQKLKAIYGMLSQKQLVNAYRKALQQKGNTAQLLSEFSEARCRGGADRLALCEMFGVEPSAPCHSACGRDRGRAVALGVGSPAAIQADHA